MCEPASGPTGDVLLASDIWTGSDLTTNSDRIINGWYDTSDPDNVIYHDSLLGHEFSTIVIGDVIYMVYGPYLMMVQVVFISQLL